MRNPKECRANAAKCAEWAANAKSPSAKQTFLDIAQTWQNLARETEALDAELENAAAQAAIALENTEHKQSGLEWARPPEVTKKKPRSAVLKK
jgi:hypothetical protein